MWREGAVGATRCRWRKCYIMTLLSTLAGAHNTGSGSSRVTADKAERHGRGVPPEQRPERLACS